MRPEGWNLADVWELVVDEVPEAPAIIRGGTVTTWAEFWRRSQRLGAGLVAAGLGRQAKVAECLFNTPEYLECFAGCVSAALVPVNTNYRYVADELVQLWTTTDVEAVVFDVELVEHVAAARHRLPKVRLWVCVDRHDGRRVPSWAVGYEELIATAPAQATGHARSGDDVILLCTGGTTGSPKGVVWRQDDFYNALSERTFRDPPAPDPTVVRNRLQSGKRTRLLPASPLAHSLGLSTSIGALCQGGTIVLSDRRGFDAAAVAEDLATHGVHELVIVGDAFAGPLNDELDRRPRDLARLRVVLSGGATWSTAQKRRLLEHASHVTLVDLFGSSETFGAATATITADTAEQARFRPGRRSVVVDQDGNLLGPGDGPGLLAIGGYHPLGYYNDPERTRRLFREIDGKRYVIPGDYARIEPDGTLVLLGRGSTVINTGGEKVFPPEVEDRIRAFPGVRDAAVVGVPDPRFGERVAALVHVDDVDGGFAVEELDSFLRTSLAHYKVPRTYALVETLPRTTNGKVDYAAAIDKLTKDGTDR